MMIETIETPIIAAVVLTAVTLLVAVYAFVKLARVQHKLREARVALQALDAQADNLGAQIEREETLRKELIGNVGGPFGLSHRQGGCSQSTIVLIG